MKKRKQVFLSEVLGLLITVMAGCHGGGGRETAGARGDSIFHTELLKKVTDSIARYPDSSRLYFERGGILYVMKQYDLAGKDLQKAISLDPLETDYYISLGEIALASDAFAAAAEAYRKALALDATNQMARLELAFVLFQQSDFRGALRQSDSLLAQDDKLVQAYGIKARALEALGDTAEALRQLTRSVSLSPHNYDALMATGDLLFHRRDTAALAYYRRAAASDTTQGEPLYCIGLVQEQAGETSLALEAYKACIDRDAYYLDAYLRMGALMERENDWQGALKIYTLATRIDPTSSEAFYHRGLCQEKLHDLAAAKRDYQDAVDLKGSNSEARAALDRLKSPDSAKP